MHVRRQPRVREQRVREDRREVLERTRDRELELPRQASRELDAHLDDALEPIRRVATLAEPLVVRTMLARVNAFLPAERAHVREELRITHVVAEVPNGVHEERLAL